MEKLVVKAEVNAPIEVVWNSFTNPEHVQQWNFAGDDWHCPSATNDFRVGGEFHYMMAARDGSFSFDFCGIYDSVEPHQSFEYHLADGRVIQVVFESTESGTIVTERFDPENENPLEMQTAGWQMILDRFKAHTESL